MQTCSRLRESPKSEVRAKPEGGFEPVRAWLLSAAYAGLSCGVLRPQDLSVWFAAQELTARRRAAQATSRRKLTKVRYTIDEFRSLTGGGFSVKNSLAKLESAGLIRFEEAKILFPSRIESLSPAVHDEYERMFPDLQNVSRLVPVPRRMLTLLAGGATRSTTAAVIGVLLRCLYWKGGVVLAEGSMKASWLAKVFKLSERSAKRARAHLGPDGIGWIDPVEMPQWYVNRFGLRLRVNLDWQRLDRVDVAKPGPVDNSATAAGGEGETSPVLAPLPDPKSAILAPPIENKKLPTGEKNQRTQGRLKTGGSAPATPAGFSVRERERRRPKRPPRLTHVVPEDLTDTERLLALFDQACESGLVQRHDAERLNFVGAAEHARVIGTRNPPGLFAWLVRKRLWNYVTAADEEAANQRLKRHFFGDPREKTGFLSVFKGRAEPPLAAPPVLSDDAEFARYVGQILSSKGFRGDPFTVVKQARADWTPERWKAAKDELDNFDLRKAQVFARSVPREARA